MYELIYDFFYENVFNGDVEMLNYDFFKWHSYSSGDYTFGYNEWLCHTASLITITIIVVLCCLFVYKIIKLIGGLIR